MCPEWPGHRAGQHVDVRLTAEDGYQAQRSYSIASAPEEQRLALTVEGLPDGEVSSYLVGELRTGDSSSCEGRSAATSCGRPTRGPAAAGRRRLRHRPADVDVASSQRVRAEVGASSSTRRGRGTRSSTETSWSDSLVTNGPEVVHTLDALPAAGMDRLRAPGGRPDARRDSLAGFEHAIGVRVRTDALRRVGRRRPRASGIPLDQRQDRAVRTDGRLDGSDAMRVDGNAIAGILGEVFVQEMTAARIACGGCGKVEPVGAEHAYMQAPGSRRCCHCDSVLSSLPTPERRTARARQSEMARIRRGPDSSSPNPIPLRMRGDQRVGHRIPAADARPPPAHRGRPPGPHPASHLRATVVSRIVRLRARAQSRRPARDRLPPRGSPRGRSHPVLWPPPRTRGWPGPARRPDPGTRSWCPSRRHVRSPRCPSRRA